MTTVSKIDSLSELPRAYNKKGRKRSWQPDELAILSNFYKQGMKPGRLAKKLNRKEASVRTKLTSLGLLKSPKLVTGGGKEYGIEALIQAQAVLKLLGYRIAITKLEQ